MVSDSFIEPFRMVGLSRKKRSWSEADNGQFYGDLTTHAFFSLGYEGIRQFT
jgi:hypothetical protein